MAVQAAIILVIDVLVVACAAVFCSGVIVVASISADCAKPGATNATAMPLAAISLISLFISGVSCLKGRTARHGVNAPPTDWCLPPHMLGLALPTALWSVAGGGCVAENDQDRTKSPNQLAAQKATAATMPLVDPAKAEVY